jgi:hypothetical protein
MWARVSFRGLFGMVAASLLLAALAGCGGSSTTETASPSPSAAAPPPVLTQAQQEVQAQLDALDADLAAAATELATAGIEGADARKVLQGLVDTHPEVTDFFTRDKDGVILAIKPDAFKEFVGTGSAEADVVQMNETKQPVVSPPRTAKEGFLGISIGHPVIADGQVIGSVGAFFDSQNYFGTVLDPLQATEGLDKLYLLDTSGVCVYNRDETRVGLNVFEDELYKPYPDMLAVMKRVVAEPSGSGSYEFLANESTDVIVKDVTWTTVGLHGTEYRVVTAFTAGE